MQLDLKDDQLKAIIGEAILRSIDEKSRDTLIKSAIEHLIAPQQPHNGYGNKRPSILEEAFQRQVSYVADQLIREILEKDDTLKERIKALIAEAAEKALTGEGLVDKVSAAIVTGLTTKERY